MIREHVTLDTLLVQIEQAQLARSLDEPDRAYMFKHALVQEAAYEPLLRHDRKRLHLLVGEAQRSFDGPSMTYNVVYMSIADHELALARGNYADLVARIDAAIPILRGVGVRLFFPDVVYVKGKALFLQGQVDEAYQVITEACVEAQAIGPRRMLWQILIALSQIEDRRGQRAGAQSLRREARAIVEYIADHAPPDLRASFLNLPDVRNVVDDSNRRIR